MNQMIEAHCKGVFRSYKTFRSSGMVVLHTVQDFTEWDFTEDRVLIISLYQQQRRKIQCRTANWEFEFANKRHYIHIEEPPVQYEVISVNHTGMVLSDSLRGEKTFFARLPVWNNLIKKSLPVF